MQPRVNRESMIWTAALNGFLANPNVDVISNADNALQRGIDFADKLVRAAQMKRFLVFGGATYYPAGGWDDYRDSFDDIDAAKEKVAALISASRQRDPFADVWAHVVDRESESIVFSQGWYS